MNEETKFRIIRVLSLIGVISALFIPLIGIILCGISLGLAKIDTIEKKHYMIFNIVAIVCTSIMWILSLV